jgi:hypothetical protein
MIDQLTPAQLRVMPTYVDKWITIGTDCAPLDPDTVIQAVQAIYTNVGLAAPQVMITQGPQSGFELYRSLGGTSMEKFMQGVVFGQHDAYWLSIYDYFHTEIGVKNLEDVFPLMELSRVCGWVYCAREVAIAMAKPEYIRWDDANRLHCETGPAIRYPDGFAMYSWHGVRVPGEWIENRPSLTAAVALSVPNVEQRRAACEILGWVNILSELNSSVLDEDEDDQIGTLVEVDIPDIGRERFLRVRCGTGREFAIPVPPNVHTALEANAWTFGLNPEDLRDLEVRT